MNAVRLSETSAVIARLGTSLSMGLLLAFGALQAPFAAGPGDEQTVGALTVLLALVPSRIGDDDQHRKEVQKLHGGAPAWGNPYHVIASVFDAKTGKRIEDVEVRASVLWRESRLESNHKRLQPMLVDDQKSWGEFFSIPSADPFRIRLEIRRMPNGPVITMEFPYKQLPHFTPRAN